MPQQEQQLEMNRDAPALLSNRRPCTSEERERVKTTLIESDYSPMADLLDRGAELTRTQITSLELLGRLPTCFANLGNYRSQDLHNAPLFTIAQAARILGSEEKLHDGKKQASLKYFKKMIADGERLNETIVVLETNRDTKIIACNTRAIAIFDIGQEQVVDVFVVASP